MDRLLSSDAYLNLKFRLGLEILFGYLKGRFLLMGGYPIIFGSNVFHNSHLIQKRIQNKSLH